MAFDMFAPYNKVTRSELCPAQLSLLGPPHCAPRQALGPLSSTAVEPSYSGSKLGLGAL